MPIKEPFKLKFSAWAKMSIKTKLILFTIFIISLSLVSMILWTDRILQDDVRLRIKANNHFNTQILASKIESELLNKIQTARTILRQQRGNPQNVWSKNTEFFYVGNLRRIAKGFTYIKEVYHEENLSENQVKPKEVHLLVQNNFKKIENSFDERVIATNVSFGYTIPMLLISFPVEKSFGTVMDVGVALINTEKLIESLDLNNISDVMLVDFSGFLVSHSNREKIFQLRNLQENKIVKIMLKSPLNNGQIIYRNQKKEKFMGAFQKLNKIEIAVITTTSEKKAFSKVYSIRFRNLIFLGFILSLALLIVLYFARSIANPLIKVAEKAKNLLDDRFDIKNITVKNEVYLLEETMNAVEHSIYAVDEEKRQRYETILESLAEAVVITNVHGIINYTNTAFLNIHLYHQDEVLNKNISILNSKKHDNKFYMDMKTTLIDKGMWQGTVQNKKKNGELYSSETTVSLLRDFEGKVVNHIYIIRDISERISYEKKLQFKATHDTLTGLPNRALFNERLAWAVANKNRHLQKFAVLFIDIDKFKSINDNYGHKVGDELLKHVSITIENEVRVKAGTGTDIVARLGGDEFAVILTSIKRNHIPIKISERIIQNLRKPIIIDGIKLNVTSSIGIVLTNKSDTVVAAELLRNADIAMYKAKEAGKDRYEMFNHDLHEEAILRIELETELKKAIEKNELELVFQPIIDSNLNRVVYFEALLRWNNAQKGYISPVDFIPIAEESGLIVEIGEWVIINAARTLKSWYDLGYNNLKVSINVAEKQLFNSNFANRFVDLIAKELIQPQQIVIELTENILIKEISEDNSSLLKLKQFGFQIALDDFGTGFSSLSYLTKLPIDIVKVDKTFVDDIETSTKTRILLENIIKMCQTLALQVVVEGIENKQQVNIIQQAKGDLIQGYFYSKPIQEKLVMQYLKKMEGNE